MNYQQRIMAITGCNAEQAKLAEAWMRLERSTLDNLSESTFRREARQGWFMARDHPTESRALAHSYGLV